MVTSPSSMPSEETVRRAAAEFGLSLEPQQVSQLQGYTRILLTWNEKLNLTAIRDPLEILYRHFCESMLGGLYLGKDDSRLADVGSGGGFPGLPLKILRPNLHVFLIESNFKRATFLAELVRELELENTRVCVGRYEELGEEVAPLDVACCRARGDFPSFLKWAAGPSVACSKVILWIGGRDLEEVQKNSGWRWDEPIAVPQSLRRYLLIGRKSS